MGYDWSRGYSPDTLGPMAVPNEIHPTRRRLLRLRFSLRTLLILVLLAASGFGLWRRWDPWIPAFTVTTAWTNDRIEFSKDEQFLFISSRYPEKNAAEIWDLQRHTKIFERPLPNQFWYSPAPGWLWTGAYDGYGEGSTFLNILTGESHTFPEYRQLCSFSNGSKAFVHAKDKEEKYLIEFPSGRKLGAVRMPGVYSEMWGGVAIEFAPDEKTFLNHGYNTSALLFNTETLELIAEIPERATGCFFTKNSTRFVLTNHDHGPLSVHDAKTGEKLWETHGYRYCNFAGKYLANYDYDKHFDVYEIETGHRLFTFDGDGAISRDGKLVVENVASRETPAYNVANVFDLESGKQTATLTDVPRFSHLFFTPDEKHIGAWIDSSSSMIYRHILWDIRGGPPLSHPVGSIDFIEDDSCIACGHDGPALALYDACTGKELFKLGCTATPFVVNESTNSRYLMSIGRDAASNDHIINVWERRRPTALGGVTWLPEFWLTIILSLAVPVSLWWDWRMLRKKRGEAQPRVEVR